MQWSACAASPAGPGGEPVQDAFYCAHQSLTGDGTITVQMTSLTGQAEVGPSQMMPGLQLWFMAGIIIKENTSQGSAYAAMMVTGPMACGCSGAHRPGAHPPQRW